MASGSLIILTGEYPPQRGGVSDYTQQVAAALAAMGRDVHVFAPPAADASRVDPGVIVHRLPDHFGRRGLRWLCRELDLLPVPRQILVQYVPHAFGCHAMNLRFCFWLRARSRHDEIWTMFHEVAFPFRSRQPLRHQLIALVNRIMAKLLIAASKRLLASIPEWRAMLQRLGASGSSIEVCPVPSNLPLQVPPARIDQTRKQLLPRRGVLIGHFGTFAPLVTEMLNEVLPPLLKHADRQLLLVGRGGQ
jgi:hypothetical protein